MTEQERYDSKIRFINMWETFKMYSIIADRYTDFCRAFARERVEEGLDKGKLRWKNPNFHDQFVSDCDPFVREMCGPWFGSNPRDGRHPLMQKIMSMGVNL